MDTRELETLLKDTESDCVERKASVSEKDKIRQAICAFANDLPDHLSEKRRSRDLPFDIRPLSSSTLKDLDFDHFRRVYLPSCLSAEILEQNKRSVEEQLTSVRFATLEPQMIPTVLGIIVIGKDPREYLSGAYIQFLRIEGTDLTDPIKDEKEIDGPLPDLLRILDEIFQAHISIALDITSQATEIRQPDYPIIALQQIARNAVLHRNYEGTNAPNPHILVF